MPVITEMACGIAYPVSYESIPLRVRGLAWRSGMNPTSQKRAGCVFSQRGAHGRGGLMAVGGGAGWPPRRKQPERAAKSRVVVERQPAHCVGLASQSIPIGLTRWWTVPMQASLRSRPSIEAWKLRAARRPGEPEGKRAPAAAASLPIVTRAAICERLAGGRK